MSPVSLSCVSLALTGQQIREFLKRQRSVVAAETRGNRFLDALEKGQGEKVEHGF